MILALNYHFARGDWGQFQDKHEPFQTGKMIKIAIKSIGTTKELLPLFRRPVKVTATFEVAMLCALGNALESYCFVRILSKFEISQRQGKEIYS